MPISVAVNNTNYAQNIVNGMYPRRFGYGYKRLYVNQYIGSIENLVENRIIPIGRLPLASILTSFYLRFCLSSGELYEDFSQRELGLSQVNVGAAQNLFLSLCIVPGFFAVQNGDVAENLANNNKFLSLCPMVPAAYNNYYNLYGVPQVQDTPYCMFKKFWMTVADNTADQKLTSMSLEAPDLMGMYQTLDIGHGTFYLRTANFNGNTVNAVGLRNRPIYESKGELADNQSLRDKFASGDALLCMMLISDQAEGTFANNLPDNPERISMTVSYSYSESDTSLCYADHYYALPFPM